MRGLMVGGIDFNVMLSTALPFASLSKLLTAVA
jgi:hypothetical protein